MLYQWCNICSGYMSLEYAMFGQFSLKFDVCSFGVLILEILIAKKNSSSCQENSSKYLLSYVSINQTFRFCLPIWMPTSSHQCWCKKIVTLNITWPIGAGLETLKGWNTLGIVGSNFRRLLQEKWSHQKSPYRITLYIGQSNR